MLLSAESPAYFFPFGKAPRMSNCSFSQQVPNGKLSCRLADHSMMYLHNCNWLRSAQGRWSPRPVLLNSVTYDLQNCTSRPKVLRISPGDSSMSKHHIRQH